MAGILIGWFVTEWFYGGFFEAYWNGQTPGKMGHGIPCADRGRAADQWASGRDAQRVPNGRHVSDVVAADFRGFAASLLFPTCFVGLVVMACNRRFQRVGDLVCGTLVVIEEKRWLTGWFKVEDPRAAQLSEFLPPDFRVSRSHGADVVVVCRAASFFHAAASTRDRSASWANRCCADSGCPQTPVTTCCCAPCTTERSSRTVRTKRCSRGECGEPNPFQRGERESR
jgi:hypothetical protein